MRIYSRLKPYFVRGIFHGIAENIHLHSLPGRRGGVVCVFNTKEEDEEFKFPISADLLGGTSLAIKGAESNWTADGVVLRLKLKAMSPALIQIGDAVLGSCGRTR